VIFKAIADGRPYPDHGFAAPSQWSRIPPRQVRLAELVTTKRTLDLDSLLSEDSTFYGDLFAHVVYWHGTYYLEDGLHRAVRAALRQRQTLHARVLNLDELESLRAPRDGVAPAPPPPPSDSTPTPAWGLDLR
jgi:Arc/MetJ family transcription regulator